MGSVHVQLNPTRARRIPFNVTTLVILDLRIILRKLGNTLKLSQVEGEVQGYIYPYAGMGFDNTTSVYVAAGKIYKEQKYMAPLKQMFPLLHTKYTLATLEELAQFKDKSTSTTSSEKIKSTSTQATTDSTRTQDFKPSISNQQKK
ncbi:O-fucosyltransferase 9 isoform X1 [Senna tora]|uniref:O-fucosyltransferase family protein n=1 Tax=Senna tora TaxID=362788 RepID=A0A834TQX5_9FABA|nr:O-fucosyltransferase 9 isoform X1 [Senna tora]